MLCYSLSYRFTLYTTRGGRWEKRYPDGDWYDTHPDHIRADITNFLCMLQEAGVTVAITASQIRGLFWFTKILRLDEGKALRTEAA